MSKVIRIGSVSIPLDSYVTAGNALLGTKGAGKTTAAKGIVEQLLEHGIPPIIFDAIGMWRWLKVAAAGSHGKGFKVVVAGGMEPDLPLTPASAPEIVRAAIRENIPLILDFYDRKLSKADWRRIVQTCFRTLLYENEGVRHIVLEETPEYAPQKVLDGETYAEVEKLVRMGGNASLGITLIGQRSQEVNKAVLDLCDNLILMKQRGAHAIDALEKWIDKLAPDQAAQVAAEMPKMAPGDVWVFSGDAEHAVRTHVGQIRTFHPDRKKPQLRPAKSATADTGEFVQRLSGELGKLIEEQKANDPAKLKARIRELEKQAVTGARHKPVPATPAPKVDHAARRQDAATIARLERALEEAMKFIVEINARDFVAKVGESVDPQALEKAISSAVSQAMKLLEAGQATRNRELLDLKTQSQRLIERVNKLRQDNKLRVAVDVRHNEPFTVAAAAPPVPRASNGASENAEIAGLGKRILDALAWLAAKGIEPAPRETTAAVARVKPSGGYYARIVGQLKTTEYISYPQDGYLQLTDKGCKFADPGDGSGDVHEQWLEILSGLEQKIVAALIHRHPASMTREELGAATNTDAQGGYFARVVGHLKTLGALEYPQAGTVALTRYVMP